MHRAATTLYTCIICFASALPARGASLNLSVWHHKDGLCLGAACTGCIELLEKYMEEEQCFASALPARGASAKADKLRHTIL